MQKFIKLTIIAIFLAGLSSLLLLMQAQAQIDAFTFFVPILTDDLNDMYDAAVNEESAASSTCNGVNISDESILTTIVITVLRDDTIVYYDQWEDGLEANLTSPGQSTTQVWGDNDPSNGSLPAAIPPNTSGGDTLTAGQVIVLQNSVTTPFVPGTFFFDGGDKLISVNGSLAVTLTAWPDCANSLFAGAWELYPTSRWGNSYLIPVGEDLAGGFNGFGAVGFNVQAAQDNTIVEFDLDGDNIFGDIPNQNLDEGENFAITSGVQTGAQIRSTASNKPVQVQILTGDPTQIPNAYEARAYTMIPTTQFTNDYIAPRSSDGLYWLHNPNGTAITVVATDSTGTQTNLNIPPNQTISFTPAGATGYRFESTNGNFYGVVTLDDDFRQDWGYALQPVAGMTTQALVGWGVGNTVPDANDSRVYVTALAATNIIVDFDNDGTDDAIFPVNPLEEVSIVDSDFDLSGAFLYSDNDVPFISVWGQDQGAPPIGNAIDVGTNVVSLFPLQLQKKLNLIEDRDNTGTLTWGDLVRFEIFVLNTTRKDIAPAIIKDTLMPNMVIYQPNTSKVDGVGIPDDSTGTPFPFDGGGFSLTNGVLAGSSVIVNFDAVVDRTDLIVNQVDSPTPITPPTDVITLTVPIFTAAYEMDKRLIDPVNGMAERGDVVTYGITITSTGNISITKMPLRDEYNPDHLEFLSATPPQNNTPNGTIIWDDLAAPSVYGPLVPSQTIYITTTYRVKIPDDQTNTVNTATVEGAKGRDGSTLPPLTDTARVEVPPVASYLFDKRLISPADGQSAPGKTVIFGLTITNTGNLSLTKMALRDTYNQNHLIFKNGIPSPNQTDPGLLFWQDLTTNFGDILPGQTINLTTTYTVNPELTGVPDTNNVATVEGVEDSLGRPLDPQTDGVEIFFPSAPATTPSNGGNNNNDDDGDHSPPAVATPLPQSSNFNPPAAPVTPEETPVIPVAFLPETGLIEETSGLVTSVLLFAGVLILGAAIWLGRRRRLK